MMPPSLFTVVPYVLALAIATMQIGTWFGIVYCVTTSLQEGGLSPVATGLAFVPGALIGMAGNLLTPRLLARFGEWNLLTFSTILLVGAQFIVLLGDSVWFLALTVAVSGFGGSLTTPALTGIVLRSFPQMAGTASGVFNTFRQVGGAIGVAVFGLLNEISVTVSLVSGGIAFAVVVLLAHAIRLWQRPART